MSKHVVILGAGFAGLELASRMSESHAEDVRVTLIDRNDSFGFGFSKLDLLLGRKEMADVRMAYSGIDKPGVEFRQETVTAIDAEARRVTTDAGSYEADFLVIALGADLDPRRRLASRSMASSTTRSPAPADARRRGRFRLGPRS